MRSNKTEYYMEYVRAWQAASCREEAHRNYLELTRERDNLREHRPTPYYRFMQRISYIKNQKGVELKDLDRQTNRYADWDDIRLFAENLNN